MRVRWTNDAARDLTQISDYIAEHGSVAAARRVALSIYQRIGTLPRFPERGRLGKHGTREIVFSNLPYLAVYRVRKDVVEILRILHGAQQWPK
jgi:toxin ParE1/3/4